MKKKSYLRRLTGWLCLVVFAIVFGISTSPHAFGEENECSPCASSEGKDECDDEDECDEDEKCNYGPCSCCARGTLLQWSYGTSFSGGPNLDEPLVTDRPDFTESAVTVGRGVAQIEAGYTFFSDDDGGNRIRFHSIGEPLLRYGIFAEWLEFRLGLFPVHERTTIGGFTASTGGIADLYTGFKIALTPQEGVLPEMALIPQMNLPTGSTPFSSETVEPGLNWVYNWQINDFLSTAGSTQGNRRIDDTGRGYFEFAQSWTAAYTLTENLGAYTEWFALIPNGADTAVTQHFFNGGFTFLVNNNVQLDIRAGVGLNDAAEDYFVGTGFAIRFP